MLLKLNYFQKLATRLLSCVFVFLVYCLFSHYSKICLLLGGLLTLMLLYPTFVYAFAFTLRRDLVAGYRFALLNIYMYYVEYKQWSIARIFQQNVALNPDKTALVMQDRSLTFQQMDELSNKVGAYFKAQKFQRGDCVALIMETRIEYPCIWLGLSKVGIVTALINFNLRRDTLLHSIKAAKCKAIIVGTELAAALQEVLHNPEVSELPIYQYSDEEQRAEANFQLLSKSLDLSICLQQQQSQDLSHEIALTRPRDKMLYVYTSGTTGMPKAAVITNLRFLFMAAGIGFMVALKPDDVIYDPLPLYHTAGGMLGFGQLLLFGCTVVLRKKFSASNFWKDCIKYQCTVAQYIGELCRYLLMQPARPEDAQHQLRLMYGNGLRAQIWTQFMTRFNIPHIGELYGSTEGNSNLANVCNQVGAVGFVPIILQYFFPVQLIRCDEESGEPLRNATGLCMRCEPGETGLLVGHVNAKRAVTAFSGYADKEASKKKLVHNVFRKGDVFFNSGDMIVSDLLGFYYFKDRTGDTFRWRGENVSTQEVEAIITGIVGLQDCVVYGVEIPHVEGKAGMAAIEDPQRKVDMAQLSAGIRGSLPAYAQPLFVRIMDEIPRTATFKMKKRDLVLEGFDMRKVKDVIYYLGRDGIYRPLTEEEFQKLLDGKAGL